MTRRPSLREIRVRMRILAAAERAEWHDAKWQRVACVLLDLGGGFALGFALGLVTLVEVLLRVGT
jgi:hypothetical protein